MSDHAHDMKKDIRTYLFVFGALLAGTFLTVWAAGLEFNQEHPRLGVTVALIIASVKAFLVAGWFMHLMSERKMIYATLAATTFFFIGLMFLTIWADADMPSGTAKSLSSTHPVPAAQVAD